MEPLVVDGLLPHLDRDRILACYRASPGKEIESGKFASPESSAALAANMFGFFLDRPADFPIVPGLEIGRRIESVDIERTLRFPWRGGRHPWLDAVAETDSEMVGIESKRYEPFRTKAPAAFSEAYSRPVWGAKMRGYEALRDALRDKLFAALHLDAVQLVKHAFGLVTQANKSGKRPVLVYLHAEPRFWPDGRPVADEAISRHRREIEAFARLVEGDAVRFMALRYATLLDACAASSSEDVRRHGELVRASFPIG